MSEIQKAKKIIIIFILLFVLTGIALYFKNMMKEKVQNVYYDEITDDC